MARHEADREDLMAEANALRERVELELAREAEHVVAGFRENGRLSVYFGGDPVYHFDAAGALRRAFVAGNLYRSQRQTLARLTRVRTEGAVELVRHDLTGDELDAFLKQMQQDLARLASALAHETARVIRQVPGEIDLRPRLVRALAQARNGGLSGTVNKR